MNLEILFEDTDLIVCVKPSGIPTQSARISTPDMVSILKNYLAGKGRSSHPYLAVIHRLDQPVTGILVFAKTPYAAKALNRQLTGDGFGKYYRAWVVGEPALSKGRLTDYLLRDGRTNFSKVCGSGVPGAKKAVLHYTVLNQAAGLSYVEIHLETGRHHQIRVQMAHMGCPILGDRKYGSGSVDMPSPAPESFPDLPLPDPSKLQLYAFRLSFLHPRTGKLMEFFREKF